MNLSWEERSKNFKCWIIFNFPEFIHFWILFFEKILSAERHFTCLYWKSPVKFFHAINHFYIQLYSLELFSQRQSTVWLKWNFLYFLKINLDLLEIKIFPKFMSSPSKLRLKFTRDRIESKRSIKKLPYNDGKKWREFSQGFFV